MSAKQWTPGKADEAWKVLVCGKELQTLNDMEANLMNLLADYAKGTLGMREDIANMTGSEILDAIEAKREVLRKTIENGLAK